MTGKELLEKYTNRDFSGSSADEYAQTLMTIWSHVYEDLYPLLERAEREGKRLAIKDVPYGDMFVDTIHLSDIEVV